MGNAVRWIYGIVMAALLLYACMLYRTTQVRLGAAREGLAQLRAAEKNLRDENEALYRIVKAAENAD